MVKIDLSGALRLREFENENAKFKRLLADTLPDNVALKDLLTKKFRRPPPYGKLSLISKLATG
jgi:putative transposase